MNEQIIEVVHADPDLQSCGGKIEIEEREDGIYLTVRNGFQEQSFIALNDEHALAVANGLLAVMTVKNNGQPALSLSQKLAKANMARLRAAIEFARRDIEVEFTATPIEGAFGGTTYVGLMLTAIGEREDFIGPVSITEEGQFMMHQAADWDAAEVIHSAWKKFNPEQD